ncbi:MAG: tRNA (adenosine(37)-N6)-dimethylallyltransferase MiaA [bacterium]|nr:tRNA (adenosine(37)-N6)-dimethylallyltransferase MiaA [bacterium]
MTKKVIVITGPTASGKTGLAIKLAKLFNGEIISADSRAIYKNIDIASAKPSLEEREGVPHWGFDLVEPGERFTAADFKEYAYKKIEDILSRGKNPFLVGGTGLYIDAVLYDYSFGSEADEELRADLNRKSIEELQGEVLRLGLKMPENYKNKRYLIRAIERHKSGRENSCIKNYDFDFLVVGITTKKEDLIKRIKKRNELFFSSGIIEEFNRNRKLYGTNSEAMTANAYRIIQEYQNGNISKRMLIDKMNTSDWRLAKRQITFMKRNRDIIWLDLDKAEQFLTTEISKNSV